MQNAAGAGLDRALEIITEPLHALMLKTETKVYSACEMARLVLWQAKARQQWPPALPRRHQLIRLGFYCVALKS